MKWIYPITAILTVGAVYKVTKTLTMSDAEKRRRELKKLYWEAASYNDHKTMNQISRHLEVSDRYEQAMQKQDYSSLNSLFWEAVEVNDLDTMLKITDVLDSPKK